MDARPKRYVENDYSEGAALIGLESDSVPVLFEFFVGIGSLLFRESEVVDRAKH